MPQIDPWIPLDLDASQRADIDGALSEIAQGIEGNSKHRAGASSLAQAALFFAYLARANRSDQQLSLAAELMDRALDALENTSMGPGLFGGIAGIGWIAHHLGKVHEAFQSTDDRNEMVDEFLFEHLENPRAIDNYDLIGGLVGYGVYFIERLPLARAHAGLHLVVERLAALAKLTPQGVCWHTPPGLLPEWQRQDSPTGYYNFGIAHGIPGILVLLARCVQVDVASSRAGELLDSGTNWLLEQEQERSVGSFYPSWKQCPDGPPRSSRVAWCYGDPGPAWSFIVTGLTLRRPDLLAHGRRILEDCTRREKLQMTVQDVPICHGAAGLLHLYRRAGRALGSGQLELDGRYWLAQTLQMRTPGRFVGGYGAYKPDRPGGVDGWFDDATFLTGISGIGLTLLSCISRDEPAWDRLLLLS